MTYIIITLIIGVTIGYLLCILKHKDDLTDLIDSNMENLEKVISRIDVIMEDVQQTKIQYEKESQKIESEYILKIRHLERELEKYRGIGIDKVEIYKQALIDLKLIARKGSSELDIINEVLP